jgi:hypothetical protein
MVPAIRTADSETIVTLACSEIWSADMVLRSAPDGEAAAEAAAEAEVEAEAGAGAAEVLAPLDPHAVAPTARAAQSTAERTSRLESMTILQRNESGSDQMV